jgi:hypothetical protein
MNDSNRRGTHPIESDLDVKEALAELQQMADRGEHQEGQGQKYFDELMEQVTLYQQMYCRNPQPTTGQMLRDLLAAAKSIRQADTATVAAECGMTLQSFQELD